MNLLDVNNITAEEIRILRKKTNMTQKSLAELFGISLSYWQRKELDRSSPNYRPISAAELWILLLLAGEHPDLVLEKRNKDVAS
ncbi:helix-turn-helix domain-containing protein [Arsenophonus nasoniae]|uniref:helix-turn-helix domain-containing protein n=1 Tax=Arsenophonus nasoniae TaxID=638 RepID=UPI0038797945